MTTIPTLKEALVHTAAYTGTLNDAVRLLTSMVEQGHSMSGSVLSQVNAVISEYEQLGGEHTRSAPMVEANQQMHDARVALEEAMKLLIEASAQAYAATGTGATLAAHVGELRRIVG